MLKTYSLTDNGARGQLYKNLSSLWVFTFINRSPTRIIIGFDGETGYSNPTKGATFLNSHKLMK